MKIAVYCGSGSGNDPAYIEAARELGRWIGKSGNTLIYGGGDAGLMGAVAGEVYDAVKMYESGKKTESHNINASSVEVIGVIPGNVEFIKNRPQPYVTKLITAENMSSRKQIMLDMADAFIALPGGIGTLDEISEAITLTKIGVFDKPCVLFNRNGFYAPLQTMFNEMEKAGFWKKRSMKHVLFSDNTEEIEEFIGNKNI